MNQLVKLEGYPKVKADALRTVKANSQRIYAQTYALWEAWCRANEMTPDDLTPDNIVAFLVSRSVTRATRQRQYAAIRKLLQVGALFYERYRQQYEFMHLVQLPDENLIESDRNTSALNEAQIVDVVNVWHGSGALQARNRALVWLMFATGLRRAEIVKLRWRDVDVEQGMVRVIRGKGGKDREPSIIFGEAVEALLEWAAYNPGEYIFRPMNNRCELTQDKPMGKDNLYRVIKQTETLSGVTLTPHVLRRTIATFLINRGASIADVQEQLGHSRANTLIEHYVKPAEARERSRRLRGLFK